MLLLEIEAYGSVGHKLTLSPCSCSIFYFNDYHSASMNHRSLGRRMVYVTEPSNPDVATKRSGHRMPVSLFFHGCISPIAWLSRAFSRAFSRA